MKPNWKTLFLLTTCCTLGLMTTAKAQVSPDGTLSTTVTNPDNLNFTINNGNRVGGNLFHSFREFSVPNNGSAVFQNALDVQNIISRVTGGSLSQINGLIQAQGSANLFLLNPAGISFGQNARLSIGGSFFATTADSLLFGDGIEFSATNPQAPLLTVNIPIGLRFRDNPGNITNQSVVQNNTRSTVGLQVNPGKSLALVGGNVSLEQGGSLTAAGGRIELGGLAGAGTVGLESTGDTFRLNFPVNGLSNVSLADNAQVTVRSNGGGDIAVNANIFTGRNGGQLVAGVEGIATIKGGDIIVNTNDISFDGVSSNGSTSGIFNNVQANATNNANAGGIDITTKNLSLRNGAEISAITFGRGDAGNVKIQASDISFDGVGRTGFPSGIFSTVQGNAVGNAGGIDITTGTLSLKNGAIINASTFAQGNAGSVKVQASDISFDGVGRTGFSSGIFSAVQGNAIGNAGGIDISTGTLSLTNGAALSASTSNRNAGNVTINASDRVSFAGLGSNGFGSGVYSLVESRASGNAGNILINAASIFLDDRAVLRTTNASNGFAGDITLNARDQVSITNNSTISSEGNLGRIFIGSQSGRTDGLSLIPNIINIENSTLSTTNNRTGSAGDITLNARDQVSITNSTVNTTNNTTGFAGDISLNARNQVSIDRSTIESTGRLGRIFIGQSINNAPPFVPSSININNSTLRTTNSGTTVAGDIALNARDQISLNQSRIESNGNFGRIFIGKNDIYGDRTSSPRVVRLEGSSLSTTNQSITGALNTPFNAGNISIDAIESISLNNQSFIQALTRRRGNAGNVTLRAENGDISLAGSSNIFSTVEPGGMGNAGAINVTSRNLSLNGSQLLTSVRAGQQGDAGNISVQASGTVRIAGRTSQGNPSGIFSTVQSGVTGDGGNITINASSIFTDDALLRTTNAGTGFAGSITFNASDQISILNSRISSEGSFGRIFIGQSSTKDAPPVTPNSININNSTLSTTNSNTDIAGDIALNAREQISLDRRSIIQSQGNRGRIFIGKNDTYGDGISSPRVVSLDNDSPLITSNGSVTGALNTPINSGDISVDALDSIFLGNGSEITAFSTRPGNAGNVTIRSGNSVTLSGVAPPVLPDGRAGGFSSGLFSSSEEANSGAGGQILVETPNLRILDGAVISARSRSAANAGNITVNSRNVELRGGGQILATAFNGGNAGNIDVTADSITISGADPTLNNRFNQVAQQFGESEARGRIDPVQPESGIFVNSTGTGQGGNLSITGNSLSLDRGVLNASTASGDGGNIDLRLRNFIRLRNESLISASAGGNGNGGNITINSPFIIAFPRNNDIIANAGSGSGGQVTINATLFGIAPLSAEDLDGLDPRQIPTSDITAISRDNPSLSRPVQVTSPDVDPSRGLVELPEAVTDPTQKVAQNPCQQGIGNEFVITGRGGLPTTPNQTLSSDNVRVDLLQPVATSGNSRSATRKPVTTVTATRVPAQGWIFNDKGQVVLTAYDPTNTGSQRSFRTAAACPAR